MRITTNRFRAVSSRLACSMADLVSKNDRFGVGKKKHETAFHALSIGETQRGEVCYRRRNEKKKR